MKARSTRITSMVGSLTPAGPWEQDASHQERQLVSAQNAPMESAASRNSRSA